MQSFGDEYLFTLLRTKVEQKLTFMIYKSSAHNQQKQQHQKKNEI